MERNTIINKVAETLVRASSSFNMDKTSAYRRAIKAETNDRAKWVLETILENAVIAQQNKSPLCDDTGVPHLFLELGPNKMVSGKLLEAIDLGVAEGLRRLPGRPMAVLGNDTQRIEQSEGLNGDPASVLPGPLIVKRVSENVIRLHILMQGGGPAIRGKTFRVFHKHDIRTVTDEIVAWGVEAVKQLGCTPCTLAIGIGRSHLEATALMTEAQIYGRYDVQSELETQITERVNSEGSGVLGLGGGTSVLATFLKVGPQRASGVRIVSLCPCCCMEPRHASVLLEELQDRE